MKPAPIILINSLPFYGINEPRKVGMEPGQWPKTNAISSAKPAVSK
jgi:hypothetical protein